MSGAKHLLPSKRLTTCVLPQAAARGVQLLLPQDVVVASRFAADAPSRVVAAEAIPDGWMVRSRPHSYRPFYRPWR